MGRILYNSKTLILAYIVLLFIFLIIRMFIIDSNKKIIIYYAFCCYMATIWCLVGLPDITYIRFNIEANIIPFKGFFNDLEITLLNVLLFVPFGFFIPLINNKCKKINITLIYGFLISLFIEISQMFTFRTTDINDLITNVSGTLIGFLIVNKIFKIKPNSNKYTLVLLLLLVFINMFIIIPILQQFF